MQGPPTNTAKHMKMSHHPNVAPPPREDEMKVGTESMTLQIPADEVTVTGDLEVPQGTRAISRSPKLRARPSIFAPENVKVGATNGR